VNPKSFKLFSLRRRRATIRVNGKISVEEIEGAKEN
jgi:hypothetical protein